MNQIETTFSAIIDSSQPRSLLSLDNRHYDGDGDVKHIVARWVELNTNVDWQHVDLADSDWTYTFSSIFDLVLINNILEGLDFKDGQQLLGQIRNYGARQIAVLASDQCDWTLNDFIGLGFHKHTKIERDEQLGRSYNLYTYNLDSYNHKRSWNNSRFWANPEMWNKSRW